MHTIACLTDIFQTVLINVVYYYGVLGVIQLKLNELLCTIKLLLTNCLSQTKNKKEVRPENNAVLTSQMVNESIVSQDFKRYYSH